MKSPLVGNILDILVFKLDDSGHGVFKDLCKYRDYVMTMKTANFFFIFCFFLLFLIPTALAHETRITAYLNSDGTTKESIEWEIEAPFSNCSLIGGNKICRFSINDKYYPSGEKWAIFIPINSKDISVRDKEGPINFTAESISDRYKLVFKNRHEINPGNNYIFYITYVENRNPVIYEPTYYYNRWVTRDDSDDSFSFKIILPYGSKLREIQPRPDKNILENNLQAVYYGSDFFNRALPKLIKLNFDLAGTQPTVANVSSSYYTINAPQRYLDFYEDVAREADKGIKEIEKVYGFSMPYDKWYIEVVNADDESLKVLERDSVGLYEDKGNIKLKITHLISGSRLSVLHLILHETIHGFNSAYFNGTAAKWWDEGTAEHVSNRVLNTLGYNTSIFTGSNDELINKCKNNEFSFITDWGSPNRRLAYNFLCNGEYVSETELGYAYSEYVVRNLTKTYGDDLFSGFYKNAEETKIVFNGFSVYSLNNQINYLLSKAVNKDLTGTLSQFRIKTDDWKDAENFIIDANTTINYYAGSSKPLFFVLPSKKVDTAMTSFLDGQFETSKNTAIEAKNEALAIEEKRKSTQNTIVQVDLTISTLESESKKQYYKSARNLLSSSVDQYENGNFDHSLQLATDAQNTAEKIEEVMNQARASIVDANRTINNKRSLSSYPILLYAENELTKSVDYFESGDFDKSIVYSKGSNETAKAAKQNSSLFYIAVISVGLGLYVNKRRKKA